MGVIASQITSITIIHPTVYSGTDQRKHQSSSSLAFIRGIHRWPDFCVPGPCFQPLSLVSVLFNVGLESRQTKSLAVSLPFPRISLDKRFPVSRKSKAYQSGSAERNLFFMAPWWRNVMETHSAQLSLCVGFDRPSVHPSMKDQEW